MREVEADASSAAESAIGPVPFLLRVTPALSGRWLTAAASMPRLVPSGVTELGRRRARHRAAEHVRAATKRDERRAEGSWRGTWTETSGSVTKRQR